jgi:hypothetical protein
MKRCPCLLVFLLLSPLACAFAAETPNQPLKVAHKSSFTMEASVRNPFWPIGWKPAVTVTTEQASAEVPASAFVVSSIAMQSGNRFAIINGKIMQEGQTFGLKLGGDIYHVQVRAIQDGRVVLDQQGRAIIVPLTRR